MRNVILLCAAAGAAAGCAVHPGTATGARYDELSRADGWLVVTGVPELTQEGDDDCGAAALAMVLARWGVDVPADTIRAECAREGVPGIRAAALKDAAKARGFSAYLIEGGVGDLEHELERGRPVLVGLVKTLGPVSATHFEVVVGLRAREEVALLDPARGLVVDRLAAFADEWSASNHATLVIFLPEPGRETRAAANP